VVSVCCNCLKIRVYPRPSVVPSLFLGLNFGGKPIRLGGWMGSKSRPVARWAGIFFRTPPVGACASWGARPSWVHFPASCRGTMVRQDAEPCTLEARAPWKTHRRRRPTFGAAAPSRSIVRDFLPHSTHGGNCALGQKTAEMFHGTFSFDCLPVNRITDCMIGSGLLPEKL